MSSPAPDEEPARADRRQAAQIEKENMQTIDPLVRRLLGELADAVWGANGPFRRKWHLTQQGSTWRVRHAHSPEGFAVRADLARGTFEVDCLGGPILDSILNEEHLRRALAVAHHRGPNH